VSQLLDDPWLASRSEPGSQGADQSGIFDTAARYEAITVSNDEIYASIRELKVREHATDPIARTNSTDNIVYIIIMITS
jgi:hypothetical protein